jgi:3-deoxy-D-manno-octulosonate 8-phosphate phosphatase (KDO 8-P phosphatase)
MCIISGGSNGVRLRLRNLGITDIHLGTPEVETFKEYAELYAINPEHVYIWETISDFHVMKFSRSSHVSKGF